MITGLGLLAGTTVAAGAYFFFHAPCVHGDQIVFDIHFSSSGWGRPSEGYVITRAGQVRRFDFYANRTHSKPPQLPQKPIHTDLLEYFSPVLETVAQIPEATMQELLTLVPAASDGVWACDHSTGADHGTRTYAEWQVDGDGVYSGTSLSMVRNRTCTNTAPATATIVANLSKYVSAPTSTVFRASMSSNANIQTRGRDCCACSGDELCVQSPDSDKYCIRRRFDCVDDDSCACNVSALCAGGHCRELRQGVFAYVQ